MLQAPLQHRREYPVSVVSIGDKRLINLARAFLASGARSVIGVHPRHVGFPQQAAVLECPAARHGLYP